MTDNKAWNALRFAGAALTQDMQVRVHLLDAGVGVGRRGHTVPEGVVDLEKLLTDLMEFGLTVSACGMSLKQGGIDEASLIEGIETGSMRSLAEAVAASDHVLTF